MSSLWACWTFGPKKIDQFIEDCAYDFLMCNGIFIGENGRALTAEGEAQQILVTKNIGAFVEILYTSMTFTTVYAENELDAYKIFIGTNASESVSLLDHMNINLNILDHDYFT